MSRVEFFEPHESDHTALVHVLWAADRQGLTLKDFDEVAAVIMCSHWFKAVKAHAITAPDAHPSSPGPTHTEQESE